jgi:hypothetical protein
MIKDLITKLAYEEISLSKALNIAKIIAKKVGNRQFENWIKNELNGYPNDDSVSDYRKMYCVVKGNICDQWGRNEQIIPFNFENWGKDTQGHLHIQYFTQSISALEANYEQLDTDKGTFNFLPEQVKMLEDAMQLQQTRQRILRSAWREIPKLQLKNIIDHTKQSLLDTLLELDKEFPNLENQYAMNDENDKKVNNIITTNVYGNNSPVNLAAGEKVTQKDISINYSFIEYTALEELGVEKKEIEDLKIILSENSSDKPSLKSKTIKWLGSISASVAAKGLYENIPAITEFVVKLI